MFEPNSVQYEVCLWVKILGWWKSVNASSRGNQLTSFLKRLYLSCPRKTKSRIS